MSTQKFQISQSRLDEIILEEVKRIEKIKALKAERAKLISEAREIFSEEEMEEIFGLGKSKEQKAQEKQALYQKRMELIKKAFGQYPDIVNYVMGDEAKQKAFFERIGKNRHHMRHLATAIEKYGVDRGKKYIDYWVEHFYYPNSMPAYDAKKGKYVSRAKWTTGGGGLMGHLGSGE